MRYDIIALDLDGTLTNEKKEITPYTKEVLMAYQKAGGCIVLASGRPPHGILPLAEELELEKYGGYMLAFNGAIVYECSTKKIIYQQTFEKPLTDIVWELGREYGVGMLTYHEDELLTEDANDEYVGIEAFITKMKVVQKENLSEAIQFPVNKMMLLADGDRLAKIEKKVQAIIGDRLSVYRSAPFPGSHGKGH